MGYDLYITWAGWDLHSREHPISREEWRAVAKDWRGMALAGQVDYSDTGPVSVYALHDGADSPASLHWRHGGITVRARGADTGAIARLAEHLGARLVGQDGEQYFTDGTVVDSDANERPPLLVRPLYVNEVCGAWTSLLDREDCEDNGSIAAQMLRSFTAIAMREVQTCRLPDADMLLYDHRTQWFDGEQMFSLTTARQFAQDDSAGGDVVRVECEARYRLTPDLLEVRAFRQWMPVGDMGERRAWLATIAERPEWRVFDQTVPDRLTLCGRAVYRSRIVEARRQGGR